jgi:predicted DNA-binding ribbon-helix-helix protein
MVRTQIQLTDDQMRALRKIASERRVSIAQLVRQAVDKLIKSGTHLDTSEQRRRAMEASGRFRSGLGDISEKHDQYFAETFDK